MKITKQEILDWKQNPTTKKMMALFNKIREEAKENLASGEYSFAEADSTVQAHAKAIGECSALKEVINVSYNDFVMNELIEEEEENVDSDKKYEDATR